MFEKYTTDELKVFAVELNEELERREFEEFKKHETPSLKQLCKEAYFEGGTINAVVTFKNFVQGASLKLTKKLIEEWAKDEKWDSKAYCKSPISIAQ